MKTFVTDHGVSREAEKASGQTATGCRIFDFKQFLPGVSASPGVYIMKDAGGEILYVGKALELRKRLASYARVDSLGQSKTAALVARIRAIETIITASEKEALILEASLIKQHRPKYNVILRDDKNYPLLKLTVQEQWPRLVMTRRRARDGARYFGPFSSPTAMWETLRYLNSLFPLRRCKEKVLKSRPRPCLNRQMGRCLAPCAGLAGRDDYLAMVRRIQLVLEGRDQQLIQELEEEMRQAAAGLRYEDAALIRDRIAAVKKTLEKQRVVAGHGKDQLLIGLARHGTSVALAFIFVRQGVISGQETFFLPEPFGSDAEIIAGALTSFYGEEGALIPKEIILPMEIAGGGALADWLSEKKGGRVEIVVPVRGDRMRLLEMAAANAAQVFAERQAKSRSWASLATALEKALHLVHKPERIECLDISNISGRQAVGSLVCFAAGEKASRFYRHYSIRTVPGPDDYAMMAEVLRRRFTRGLAEGDLPDLLLVDGGKGQLGVAMKVCAELGVPDAVELAGIAKERAGEGEKIYRPGRKNPIVLPGHSPALLYLMRIRDEAHRYGITRHRKQRGKEALTSTLAGIPGLGKVRIAMLLRELGSVAQVAEATATELSAIPGIGPGLAEKIWRHLHQVDGA